jgi:hypothetical protein
MELHFTEQVLLAAYVPAAAGHPELWLCAA